MALVTSPNIADADLVYVALVDAHRGLDAAGSAALDARLVLLLANHIGDAAVIRAAIAVAKAAVAPAPSPRGAQPQPTAGSARG